MLLIGLTGGIGMGKSTVATFLVESGERVIDTDELARELVAPGQPALDEIRREFGQSIFRPDGSLDRHGLGALVFSDPQRRERLESILHPRVRSAWLGQAAKWRAQGEKRATVVIPLLYETGAETQFDLSICVACSRSTQHARLQKRGWNESEIANRLTAQRPIVEKMGRADRVIWNESSPRVCEIQANRIFASL